MDRQIENLIISIIYDKSPYPIKGREIVQLIRMNGRRINEIDLRKHINDIRSKGKAPIIANSKGYYISKSEEEILKEIHSLRHRSIQIFNAAKGLKKYLNKNQLNIFKEVNNVSSNS